MRILFSLILSLWLTTTMSAQNSNTIEDKHLFIFFYKEVNEKTQSQEKVFDEAMQKIGLSTKFIKVNVKDQTQQALIDKYNLKRTPMPFVLVIAPNGAITGGYSTFTEEQLRNAIVSHGTAQILKGLQDQKLVILALQNNKTKNNAAAMQGVSDFKADPRFSTTEIVVIDPSDTREHTFLKTLSLDTNITQAQTVLIAPPADVLGIYQGPTTKKQLVDSVQNAASGECCPGGKCG